MQKRMGKLINKLLVICLNDYITTYGVVLPVRYNTFACVIGIQLKRKQHSLYNVTRHVTFGLNAQMTSLSKLTST